MDTAPVDDSNLVPGSEVDTDDTDSVGNEINSMDTDEGSDTGSDIKASDSDDNQDSVLESDDPAPSPWGAEVQEDPAVEDGEDSELESTTQPEESSDSQLKPDNFQIGQECSVFNGCGDSSIFQCSQKGKCLDSGTYGAFEIGDSCGSDEFCAFGLQCIDSQCSEGGE
jgi:hypothetical protein